MATLNTFEVIREFFPKLTPKEAMDFLWAHTSFPFFREDPEVEFRQQLMTVKMTMDSGRRPCDFCGKPAEDKDTLCKECGAAWAARHEEKIFNALGCPAGLIEKAQPSEG